MGKANLDGRGPVRWDPYDAEIRADPYPVYRRLRDEAPLHLDEKHGFYALSRFEDVERCLLDPATYSSARGAVIELIQANVKISPGGLVFEDPPVHTHRRKLLARVFTPRRMEELEPRVRQICQRRLEPLVDARRFDFVADVAVQIPLYVIGLLLGIPEEDFGALRDRTDGRVRTDPGQGMRYSDESFVGDYFRDYVEWRAAHPSDDLMSELLAAEFEDETGAIRKLTRSEVLTFTSVLATAGAETTVRMLGWAGKLLADHPDQRRRLVGNPPLIPQAIEEILRFESPAPYTARYTTRDVEHHGEAVPAGSIVALLLGSANRDERRYPEPDRFDVGRRTSQQLAFGWGIHVCLGAALARLEGRVALEEILARFPEWEVDMAGARLASTSIVRGWESLPVSIR
jgi:cytochrome P450